MRIEIFADEPNEWRWRLLARNGKLVCTSGEAFHSKGNASRAAKTFLRNIYKALHTSHVLVEVVE